MKTHLPILLRRLVLSVMLLPVEAALTWDSGNWNTTDAAWRDAGIPAVFSNGDAVEFTAMASSTTVSLEELVEPSSMLVSGSGFVFTGSGQISGAAGLTLAAGASLAIQNANTYNGGTMVDEGASLTLTRYDAIGSTNTGEQALGVVSGGGTVCIAFADTQSEASIVGQDWVDMHGVLYVQQGIVGLGRRPGHGGAGQVASLSAQRVDVGGSAQFITSLGGGQAGLNTDRAFSCDVRTEDGAVIGNRDGYINWTGRLYLNMQDVSAAEPVYNEAATTVVSLYYGKYVVWDGIAEGGGIVALSAGLSDVGADHRLVLANAGNTFSGVYQVKGEYLSTLALAAPTAAAEADVQLDTASSRLMLMRSNAEIASLSGPAGVVLAEGDSAYVLSLSGGNFSGTVQDSASPVAGLSLGLTKVGSAALNLVGTNCSYTGVTTVQGGTLYFSGDVALGSISVQGVGSRLEAEGNLTLRQGGSLSIDMAGASEGRIQAGGRLELSDSTHVAAVSGYESLPIGSYDLVNWGTQSDVSMENFIVSGLNDTAEYLYTMEVQGNALKLVVSAMEEQPWLWSGGSADWLDDSTAGWSNTTGSGPAGQAVIFGPENSGTITISRVTPAQVSVLGGEYSFVANSSSAEGIVSAGILRVSGENTLLNLNLNNASFTGSTVLQGGTLVLGAVQALGSSSLLFNGGLLRYADGITPDVSGQIHADSSFSVRVDTNGNTVNWSNVDGVKQTLSSGVTKYGDGTLQLDWSAGNDTHSGDINILGGTLFINKLTSNGTLNGVVSGSGVLQLSSAAGTLTVGGDNSDFAGTLKLAGDGQRNTGIVRFMNGAAMGGADTLVQISGQRFWFSRSTTTEANLEIMEGSTTYFDGSTGVSYTFSGNVSGSGNLLVVPSCTITMTGDVSEFTGYWEHPGNTAVTWQLGGEGIVGSGKVQANLGSPGANMVFSFWYASPTEMSGSVSGSARVRQRGAGTLTLTGQNTTTGNLVIENGCEVRLGSAERAGAWAGTAQLGTGSFVLVNGTIAPLDTMEGTLSADVAPGAVVDIGGMDANAMQDIRINAGGLLTGISGTLTIGGEDGPSSLYLTPAAANISHTAVPADGIRPLLEMENGSLTIQDAAAVTLDLETVKAILQGLRQTVYIHISNVDIELTGGMSADALFQNSLTSPAALGLVVLGVEGGNIVLEGAVRDVYMVSENGDSPTVTSYDRLQPYKATFIDSGYTLSLNLPGDNSQQAWVNNLLGSGDLLVSNTQEGSGVVRVLLNNEALGDIDSELSPEDEAQVASANTEFQGNIRAGEAVQLVKTGSGTLNVGGSIVADWLEMDEGTLRLTGSGSVVESLHGDAALVLDGAMEITGNALAFTGELSGSGILLLNGMLNGSGSVGNLNGSGSLHAADAVFSVQNIGDAVFSGSLEAGQGTGTLEVRDGGGSFTLQRVRANEAWTVRNRGKMILHQAGDSRNSVLTLGTLQLLAGSDTVLVFNTDMNKEVLNLQTLLVEDGAMLTLNSTGQLPLDVNDDGTVALGSVAEYHLGADNRVPLTLGSGTVFRGIEEAWLSVQDGTLILHTRRDESNQYAANASSANSRTGAELLWHVPNSILRQSPDLTSLTHALDALVAQGNSAGVDALLSAAAGAGAAALGSAVAGDMERQLRAIRNRTTSMGLDSRLSYDDLPLFNAWVNAEGDRRELKSDGTEAGYTLSSWGATIGADADFSPTLTAGLAFTGMYGDFQGHSPDHADGDADFYYLTLFGRYAVNRWTHTLVGAVGWADISLKRHVNYAGGGYRTRGNTDGQSIGLLYELGYVIPMDEEGDSCLQPILSCSYRHASVDAYTEHGSDAGLRIGSQSMDVVTFGAGMRAQTYALENSVNRKALLEARALLKVDAGDRHSSCDVSLLALNSRRGRVHSADDGRVGMELGAGISVPISESAGFIFMDASFELRADETDVNGTVGYRLSF